MSGYIGTAGVSKSNERCYVEANTQNRMERVPPDANVSVIMPAVGFFGDEQIWDHLDEYSPPLVLTHGHTSYGLHGADIDKLRDYYLAAGLEDKLLYFNNSRAGHEYNVYDLDSILAFFDKFCQPSSHEHATA